MTSSTTQIDTPNSVAQKRALLAARLQKAANQPRQAPLSFAQQRLWFLDQLEPNSPLYNIGTVADITGALDVSSLQKALERIVGRHETLRTRFECSEEIPIQIVDPSSAVRLGFTDLRQVQACEREGEVRRLVQAELNRPFDLTSEHPLRASLFQTGTQEYRFVLILHHIVADEWSLKIFFNELATLYRGFVDGRDAVLPDLPAQYIDYGHWQRKWLQGEALQNQLSFWKEHLHEYPEVTELPTDHPRGLVPSFRGKTSSRQLRRGLGEALKEVGRQRQATLFMVLLAAFKTLVHRYTQQEDLIICSPVAGRNRVETEGLIGFFVNTLALRSKLKDDLRFDEVLDQLRKVVIDAMNHQDLPFDRLVEELQPERSLNHLPFTRLMFSFQTDLLDRLDLAGATLKFLEVEPELAKFDVTLTFRESGNGLTAHAEYNCDLFEAQTIDRLLGHLEVLLEGIVAQGSTRISELPLLTAGEERKILVEWNDTGRVFPRDRCVHELFEAQAARTPNATAVVWGHQRMTYGELNARANQLAGYLKRLDVKSDVPVGLCLARSIEMLVGMLGILKSGGAYVPLDANYPKDRLAFMLEDSDAPVILTEQRLLGSLSQDRARVICLDADWELIARAPRENISGSANAQNLAYIMYTSGSTGRPKGVCVTHRGINRLVINNEFIAIDSSDRIAQVSNISFDAATFEIWGALLNGGQLVGITRDVALSPADFAAELREQRITAMFLTAALFNQLASEAPGAFENLRTVIAGGEALDPKWIRAVLNDRPPRRLVNGYGPTENTTFTCSHAIAQLPDHATNVPIGRPISNTKVYILDRNLKPVPIGVRGELYTGGDGIARGYWKRPELTAERFVPNPFDAGASSKLYKTGDLARYLPDGTVEFLGRMDEQLKIRGFRIEPGEIEALLSEHPGVRECVVGVVGSGAEEKRLVAYVVARTEPVPNASELRSFLMNQLPDYMVPSTFVTLEALPLTPNGKVDRKNLPAPDHARPSLDKQYVGPQDETETKLVRIWEAVLAVKPIGIQDRFFDLGGHSMLAVRVIAQIEKAFGRRLRLATLFQAPTIERLARVLREEIKETAISGTSLVEIQRAGSRPPLFLVHGAGGGMFWGYINLARGLGPDQPVYGFKSRGLDGEEEFGTITEMASRYVADLRKIQPKGPYHLGGYCFGGNVAYEMACQIEEQGEKVAVLALLNCAPPHSSYSKIPWTPGWWLRFGRNLLYWGNYFGHWSATQRKEFFRWKWQLFKKRLSRSRRAGNGDVPKLDPGDIVDLSSCTEDQKKTWEAHIRALMDFRPRPYPGCVHLFRSPGHPLWCSFDQNYGWGDLARGGVKLFTVSGAHEKILEEPWVKGLARTLSETLASSSFTCSTELAKPQKIELNAATGLTPIRNNAVERIAGRSETVEATERLKPLEYWKEQLGPVVKLLDLPSDRPRPAHNLGVTASEPLVLPKEITGRIQQFAKEAESETSDVIIAALAAVFERYTGLSQLVIGTSVSSEIGESRALVPLRCDLSGQPSFKDLVGRIKRTRDEACRYCDVSFSEIVGASGSEPSPSYAPVFQVFCSLDVPQHTKHEIQSEVEDSIKQCDLTVRASSSEQGISGLIQYNGALFEAARIKRFGEHLETLLKSGLDWPDIAGAQLDMLTEREARTLLVDWNATQRPYPKDKTLAALFYEQALRTPDCIALVSGESRLTYRDLYEHANNLAVRLSALGAGREKLVAICLERSVEMVVAILGSLVAGAAYVPLDPKYPRERLMFTLQDARASLLITSTSLRSSLGWVESPVFEFNSVTELEPRSTQPDGQSARPDDLAYVIYTSGSTGKPKGVALENRNAVEMVSWAKETFSTEELSGVLFSTSICFDLSVFEMFVPLCWGGKVILAENAFGLPNLAAASEVRLINTVPSAIRELLRMRAVPSTVKAINLAGEPLSAELVDQIYRETAATKVFDLYGPTETTTYSTGGIRRPGHPATIGRPLYNEQVYLVDRSLRLVPIGNPGELLIGGDGLARSYLHRPELTQEKFIANPFNPGTRLYRTGDLARWNEDGTLEYLGRIDHQVKIRGFRIELGEIEAVLKSCPHVLSAVVVAREDRPGDQRLVAYLVARAGISLATNELRAAIRAKLPDFMMPSEFVFLDELPLTPNGKIDRKALPAPANLSNMRRQDVIVARTPIEQQLAAIWREVLHLGEVSMEDNFFELGGHSLSAVRVVAAIRDAIHVELPIPVLFSAPTLSELAAKVSKSLEQNGAAAPTAIQPVPRGADLPLSYVQERLWFLDQLEPGSAAYNVATALRLKGELNSQALGMAINTIIARHESLRSYYENQAGRLIQRIKKTLCIEVEQVALPPQGAGPIESAAQDLINEHARRPFDLAKGPLVRASLFRFNEEDHALLVVMHHSVSDGWSVALFFEELAENYQAQLLGHSRGSVEPLPIQYADFAAWQRGHMSGAVLADELSYWKSTLSGALGEIKLPLDHPRPANPTGRAGNVMALLTPADADKVAKLARQSGCTPFMIFLTGLIITLKRWTGETDLVVGTVVAGRTRREVEKVIGCFMNFLPLRVRVADGSTGKDLLHIVRATVLDAQSHQECPFEKIVEAVNPQRHRDQNPLYNVGLLLQNFPENPFEVEQLRTTTIPVSLGAALLDLRFEIQNTPEGLSLGCEYKTDLFERETVQGLIDSLQYSIRRLVDSPNSAIAEFQLAGGFGPTFAEAQRPSQEQERIVVSATFTAEPVADSVRYWLDRLQLPTGIEFAPYNQVFQQLLDSNSVIGRNRQGLNVLLLRLEDWLGKRGIQERGGAVGLAGVERNCADFVAALKSAADRGPVPFLVSICPASPHTFADGALAEALARIQSSVESQLSDVAGVNLLTWMELRRWYPVEDFYDPAGEELGQVPYTTEFFTSLGTGLVRKYHALKRPPYKVIALDCDNTLWKGICGEEGPEGIELDAGRRALQEFVMRQRDAGMLLCLCSKNNEEDVHAVFTQRSDFPLQLSHMAAWRLNWMPKSANLRSLARELNVGLDSFVFIDDNPVECAEVQEGCPEVATLQLPAEPGQIGQFLNHCWVFDHLRVTREDKARAQLYEQNRLREQLRLQAPTLEQFLESLELKVAIEPLAPEDQSRIVQLTQRTNQFNLTTRRMTEPELARFLISGQVFVVRVSDRFGDYGLVGAVFYRILPESVFVDNLLLSCRVLGRGIEHRILARLGAIACERKLKLVDVKFVPSAKNQPGLNFLEECCGNHKQPLNGGSVFRVPAELAAKLSFHPKASRQNQAMVIVESNQVQGSRGGAGSVGYGAIAQEAGDWARIHERVRKPQSSRAPMTGDYFAPQTDLEKKLAVVWQELLRIDKVGLNDDFFELGGHSLLAVRLFAEIEKLVGRKFPLVTLFHAPTISQLAKVLAHDCGAGSLLVPIQPKGERPPLFLVHGAGGDVLWGYANLAGHMAPDQPIYGIRSAGQQGREEKTQLEEMARSYLEVVRSQQPRGPYYLGGYCFGGNVAYEMARQLRLQGEEVGLVVLLDSAPANAGYETVTWWQPGFLLRFVRNLRYWLHDFAALESIDRRRLIGRKIRALGRKLKKRLSRRRVARERFNVEEVIDPRHFPEHELKLWQTHLEALIAHVERPYSGRVALLRTRGQPLFCSLKEDFCWGKLVSGQFTIGCIPGSHENIFIEPNVRVLASELSRLLQESSPAQLAPASVPTPVTMPEKVSQL